jgi:primosomal protein N' (replication factor Y)
MASLSGPPRAVASLLAATTLPPGAELLGPLPAGGRPAAGKQPGDSRADADAPGTGPSPEPVRYLVRVPRSEGTELALALRSGQAARSAAKEPGAVRVQLDPAELI